DRMAGTAGGAETACKAGNAALHLEAALFEQLAHELRCLEFLHPQFGKVEDAVVERGNGPGIAIQIIEAKCLLGTGPGNLHAALPSQRLRESVAAVEKHALEHLSFDRLLQNRDPGKSAIDPFGPIPGHKNK